MKKNKEFIRYEKRADKYLSKGLEEKNDTYNSLKEYLKPPYDYFIDQINHLITEGSTVLEIGSGFGQWSKFILDTGAKVIASDISPKSLEILHNKYNDYKTLKVKQMSMDNITFPDNYFDHIISAGSLSYAENKKVINEIHRVLKPNGYFICIDSLNNNPIYFINRLFKTINGQRSFFTLINMPSINLLNKYKYYFKYSSIKFFGVISFLGPLFFNTFLYKYYLRVSKKVDSLKIFNPFAFKFVMIVRK